MRTRNPVKDADVDSENTDIVSLSYSIYGTSR